MMYQRSQIFNVGNNFDTLLFCLLKFIIKIKAMNSIHRSGFSTNYYNGFTPEKSLSTRLSHLNSTAENK